MQIVIIVVDTFISIHALLAESDTPAAGISTCHTKFLSTLSLRRATPFQGIPRQLAEISIHALLAESDATLDAGGNDLRNFYPRSPCGERLYFDHSKVFTIIFLSTLSLRRATGKPGQRI